MKSVEALFCSDHTHLSSNLFRASHVSEKRVNGVVYRRTGLDDGPRYLIDSQHSTDRCVRNIGHDVTSGAKRHV